MIRKKIKNILHNKRRSLVKFTGLFVFLGIMALASACNGEPVLYSVEEPETYEESKEAETGDYADSDEAGEKSGSGTVTIRSYRTDDACVVEVKDDGAGFDTSILGDLKPDSEHNRIALRNVSVRVEQMCQGQLKIDSTPGEGTVVTISIPIKKDA